MIDVDCCRSAAVRFALELRALWLHRMTPSAFHRWLDAFESLSHADALDYARAVR